MFLHESIPVGCAKRVLAGEKNRVAKHRKLRRHVLAYKHVLSTLTRKAFTRSFRESFR